MGRDFCSCTVPLAPPLYSPEYLATFEQAHPGLTVVEVPDVNHYTIVMNTRGADAVADAISHPKEPA